MIDRRSARRQPPSTDSAAVSGVAHRREADADSLCSALRGDDALLAGGFASLQIATRTANSFRRKYRATAISRAVSVAPMSTLALSFCWGAFTAAGLCARDGSEPGVALAWRPPVRRPSEITSTVFDIPAGFRTMRAGQSFRSKDAAPLVLDSRRARTT